MDYLNMRILSLFEIINIIINLNLNFIDLIKFNKI